MLHEKCDKNSVLHSSHLQKTLHACSHRIYRNRKWENGFVRRWLIMARSRDCIKQCRIHLFFVVNSLCSQSHSITFLHSHIYILLIISLKAFRSSAGSYIFVRLGRIKTSFCCWHVDLVQWTDSNPCGI